MARLSAGHARSRTQIIPICVIGADSDEIGEAMQNGGSRASVSSQAIAFGDGSRRRPAYGFAAELRPPTGAGRQMKVWIRPRALVDRAGCPAPPCLDTLGLARLRPRAGNNGRMRVVVTRIEPDGTMQRRVVNTARRDDGPRWEDLAARALASPPPYHPIPGAAVYHVSVDDHLVQVGEYDLDGPLRDLVTVVLAVGDELLAAWRAGPVIAPLLDLALRPVMRT